MKSFFVKKIFAVMLSAALLTASVMPIAVYAEEPEAAETEEEGAELPEEYIEGELEESSGELVMSQIASSNDRMIAASFPDDYLPEGFHKDTCTYEGQTIEIARLDKDESGEVVLAYLADADGSNGDFYLCDIMTAEMSDFIQMKNGNNGYIIVLDPGDVIVAPSGFKRATFKFYGKTGTAWKLPEAKASAKADTGIENPFAPVEVYAASAGAGALDSLLSNITNAGEASAEESDSADESASEEEGLAEDTEDAGAKTEKHSAASAAEDGSRIVTADPSEFIMVYAIDNTGTVGFYLYDTVQETYQRYVAIDGADSSQAEQYKKDSKNRLIIICVLAVVLVIMLFVIVNLLLNKKDEDYDDDEDEDYDEDIEAVRNNVDAKSKKAAAIMREEPKEEFGDEFEEEENYEDEYPYPARNEAPLRREAAPAPVYEDEDEYEEEPVRRSEPVRRQASRRQEAEPVFTRNGQVVKRTGVPMQPRRQEAAPVISQPKRNPEAGVVRRTAPQGMSAPVRRPSTSQENVEQRSVVPKRRPAADGAASGAQVRRPRPNNGQGASGRAAVNRPKPAPRPKPDLDEDFDFDFD